MNTSSVLWQERTIELTILMPCLDEIETITACIEDALGFLKRSGISGEVLIADNGSTDGSIEAARLAGARVIEERRKGYGSALRSGIKEARGKSVIMGDCDCSYDFSNLEPFIKKLRDGEDLVMGNRFKGGIEDGAMPALHKYLGNPVLSFIGRLFYRIPVGDFHCGLRGFSKEKIQNLGLVSSGMEFASEMVVKSAINDYKISEVPTTLAPDGRSKAPHLRSWRDGWRHLRFLLLCSPSWLFMVPGLACLTIGVLLTSLLIFGEFYLGSIGFDVVD